MSQADKPVKAAFVQPLFSIARPSSEITPRRSCKTFAQKRFRRGKKLVSKHLRSQTDRRLKKPLRGRNVSQPSHIPVLV